MVKGVPIYLPLTPGTSLVRYPNSLPGRYYFAVQSIEISFAKNQESASVLSRKQRVFFYDQQGQIDRRTRKGIFIDFYC
jgi:hypothetical protein